LRLLVSSLALLLLLLLPLFHVLLVEIDQDGPDRVPAVVGRRNGEIGVDFVLRRVVGQAAVGEAHAHGQRRVAHEFRPARHVWDLVGIGVHVRE